MSSESRESINWLEHDADIRMEGCAPDLESLFRGCARELVRAVCGSYVGDREAEESIRLTGVDREDLLVAWLNEVLFLIGAKRFVPKEIIGLKITERDLSARLRGVRVGPGQLPVVRDIKAATYHDLQLRRDGTNWKARIIFDV